MERLRRLWWLELGIVLMMAAALSRWGGWGAPPAAAKGDPTGQALSVRFQVADAQGRPVSGATVQVDRGTDVTSSTGTANVYTVMPAPKARRLAYTVTHPQRPEHRGTLELPDRPGESTQADGTTLRVSEIRQGLLWRVEVRLTLP